MHLFRMLRPLKRILRIEGLWTLVRNIEMRIVIMKFMMKMNTELNVKRAI